MGRASNRKRATRNVLAAAKPAPGLSPERLRILIEFDVEAGRQLVPLGPTGRPMSTEAIVAGLHKTRLMVAEVPAALRRESAEWLRANGFSLPENAKLDS